TAYPWRGDVVPPERWAASARAASRSRNSRDQLRVALRPSASARSSASAAARAASRAALIRRPRCRGAARGTGRLGTRAPSPRARRAEGRAGECPRGAQPWRARQGARARIPPPALRSAARRSPRCCASAPPAAATPHRSRPARRARLRASRLRLLWSCSLPVALEAGIGHEQLFHSDVLVVKGHAHLEIAPAAAQSLNRATAEPAVPYPLALHVPGRILGCLLRGLLHWRPRCRGCTPERAFA